MCGVKIVYISETPKPTARQPSQLSCVYKADSLILSHLPFHIYSQYMQSSKTKHAVNLLASCHGPRVLSIPYLHGALFARTQIVGLELYDACLRSIVRADAQPIGGIMRPGM